MVLSLPASNLDLDYFMSFAKRGSFAGRQCFKFLDTTLELASGLSARGFAQDGAFLRKKPSWHGQDEMEPMLSVSSKHDNESQP